MAAPFRPFGILTALAMAMMGGVSTVAIASSETRCVVIEVYGDSADAPTATLLDAVDRLQSERKGIRLVHRDPNLEVNRKRLTTILKHFRLPEATAPVVYGCNQILYQPTPENSWSAQLEQLITMEVFVRPGCSHCQAAKNWIPALQARYPALQILYRDLLAQPENQKRLTALVARHRVAAASVPTFHVCHQLVVGFDNPETTGRRIDSLLTKWTQVCPTTAYSTPSEGLVPRSFHLAESSSMIGTESILLGSHAFGTSPYCVLAVLASLALPSEKWEPPWTESAADSKSDDVSLPPDELPLEDLPLPTDPSIDDADFNPLNPGNQDAADVPDEIDLPLFGRLSAEGMGLPLFTIAVGLVDGFNPCAMWILLFLLSILVNLKDRIRILAIAGTFVIVSGVAYFAFMAAWLNVFLLIGYLRPIQLGLGLLAVGVGSIHIKDFFAFKQGISLSIPESAKPGLYARVRRIVTAEHLTGAIAGATVLAILVNVIELLCTAGLPALYTSILAHQGLSLAGQYGYLLLYILAYMFDDCLMVAVVVVTLSRTKLQESHGRWLKLVSGLAIAVLGLIMVFKPEWLG